jgi:hypothetical protein
MQTDAYLPVVVTFVPEGIFNLRNFTGSGTRELVSTHGVRHVAVTVNLVIIEDDLAEALLGVDGEALIFFVPANHGVVTHEVGHGIAGGGSELLL